VAVRFYWLLIAVLVVWRLTHLFYGEDGPWKLLVRLRHAVGDGFWGSLLDCFYCLSLWMAAPLAWLMGANWKQRLMLWPALSAGAILLERLTVKNETKVQYYEEEESDHVLRQRPSSTENSARNDINRQ
jgi:hypothetical protein